MMPLKLYKVNERKNLKELLPCKMLSKWLEHRYCKFPRFQLLICSHVPTHSTKEVVVIFGALISSDAGDIHNTIKSLVDEKVLVRVVGLAAQVAVCRELCNKTNAGDECKISIFIKLILATYGVVLNEQHFRDLFFEVTTPPATHKTKSTGTTLIMMGFPSRTVENHPSLCAWYADIKLF